jgi:hypothetical protein
MLMVGLPYIVHGATLYIDPAESVGYRADTKTLAVRIDTDTDECINTIDASIEFSPSISAIEVSDGESILPLWVERPTIDTENRRIRFAGGIPNGYCGRVEGDPKLTNIVVKLVFQIPGFSVGAGNGTTADVAFLPETQVLLNDGLGTPAPLTTIPARISFGDTASSTISDSWTGEVSADTIPPTPFSIELVQNNEVFSGKHYIVFNTTDKQSGIDHFEVLEEPLEELSLFKWGIPDLAWVEVKSPYVLKDQELRSVIRVKAIDNAGNEHIAVLASKNTARLIDPMSAVLLASIACAILVLLAVFIFFVRRIVRRHRAAQLSENSVVVSPADEQALVPVVANTMPPNLNKDVARTRNKEKTAHRAPKTTKKKSIVTTEYTNTPSATTETDLSVYVTKKTTKKRAKKSISPDTSGISSAEAEGEIEPEDTKSKQ